ncbi:GPO family capsid scaffolding protein [Cupriavidus sp. CuC1]|uniref:GPO family capsid scaffolding protein n=1 Tax=Cupriavidus sp. CuC1 TaxID=3373131 RepID=UPI0037D8A6C5
MDPNFAKSGEAYLIGLGVTDSPASLGTEVLSFAAQKPESHPYAARKQSKDNLFSAAVEAELEFVEDDDDDDRETFKTGILDKVKQMFGRNGRSNDARQNETLEAIEFVAEEFSKPPAQPVRRLSPLSHEHYDVPWQLRFLAAHPGPPRAAAPGRMEASQRVARRLTRRPPIHRPGR